MLTKKLSIDTIFGEPIKGSFGVVDYWKILTSIFSPIQNSHTPLDDESCSMILILVWAIGYATTPKSILFLLLQKHYRLYTIGILF
jgi:hypothetical protein